MQYAGIAGVGRPSFTQGMCNRLPGSNRGVGICSIEARRLLALLCSPSRPSKNIHSKSTLMILNVGLGGNEDGAARKSVG